MSECGWFDDEALPRLEAGLAIDESHFAACPRCRTARESHERLLAALGDTKRLAPHETPRPDWRSRVLAEVDGFSKTPETGRYRRGWLVAAGLLAASVATVLVLTPNRLAPPGLTQRVVEGATQARGGGEAARPGDRLELAAGVGTAAHAELRLYWNRERLVLRCSGEKPPCRRRGERLEAEFRFDLRGRYLPLLLWSAEPLPPPGANFDADTAAALAAGARVEVGREVTVR